jgi:hypothetical protein
MFAKLIRECDLLSARFTNTDVDIIFSQVRVRQWLLWATLPARRPGCGAMVRGLAGRPTPCAPVALFASRHPGAWDCARAACVWQSKTKGSRKLTFAQFQAALQLIATKRFPEVDPAEALEGVVARVCASGGPESRATVADVTGVFSKMTDASLYTGAHKHRFEDGSPRAV